MSSHSLLNIYNGLLVGLLSAGLSFSTGINTKKTGSFLVLRVLPVFIFYTRGLVAGGAEEAEEVDEEIDEVEVKGECTPGGEGAVGKTHVHGGHLLYFLGVPGGETDENQHSEPGDDPFECAVGPEDVDQAAYDEAEEGHIEE